MRNTTTTKKVSKVNTTLQATETITREPRNCSIAKFVSDRGIARQTYYNLKKRGLAPVTLHVLGRRIITPQAVLDWEAKMAALTAGAQ